MPRVVVPDAHHPSLQFRYMVTTSKLPSAQLYCRSAQQPSYDNAPVNVEHINYYFKVKGKTRWNDITLSMYQFEGITVQELYDYLNNDHHTITPAEDKYAPSYKHDMQIMILGPDGSTPINTWKLVGAFIGDASWGDMDYGTDDVIQCDMTVCYDYATLS